MASFIFAKPGGKNMSTKNVYGLCQAMAYRTIVLDEDIDWTASKKKITFTDVINGTKTFVEVFGKFGSANIKDHKINKLRINMESGSSKIGWSTISKIKDLEFSEFIDKDFDSLTNVVLKGNDLIKAASNDETEVLYGHAGKDDLHLYKNDVGYGGSGADKFSIYKTTRAAKIKDFDPDEGDTIFMANDNPKSYEYEQAFGNWVIRHKKKGYVLATVEYRSISPYDLKLNAPSTLKEEPNAFKAYQEFMVNPDNSI